MKITKRWLLLFCMLLLSTISVGCNQGTLYEGKTTNADIESIKEQSFTEESAVLTTEDVLEEWRLYLQDPLVGTDDEIKWVEEQLKSDFSEWFSDYNGEKLHRIENTDELYKNSGPAIGRDIVYYKAEADEDIQEVLNHMIDAMLLALMKDSDERTYTITQYALEEHPVMEVIEGMWLVKYFNGYYAYEGTEFVPMDVRLQNEKPREDGLISFVREGSPSVFHYVLLEKDGVYRLQLATAMREDS